MHALQARIIRFYRRWHELEAGLGPAVRGLVIDFDMAPPVDGADVPFERRSQALAELHAIQGALPGAPSCNPDYLRAKLGGSEAYLRALMGERISFAAYNRATMGYDPTPVPDATLEGWRQELEEGLGALGVRWSVDGREAWRERVGVDYTPALGQALRDHARAFAARVQALVPGLPDPEYTIRVVEEDAYWSNWIDGSADQGITLQINTHPRIEYKVDSALSLAAHEIGGHAMHVAALRRGVAQGTVDPAALCLTVHACEAFQMEGLAQVVLDLLGTADETGGLHPLQSLLRTWSAALSNNAQLRLEAGEPVHDVLHDLVAAYPLANPMSLESGLRDRARSPLLRSYIPVYGPSRALFLRAVALPDARRAAFFRDAYTGLWTPDQLEAKLTA